LNKENHIEPSWDIIIKPKASYLRLNFKEVWAYRDLIMLFVKRDFVSIYKQTILGPLWYIIQPVLTTITFTIIFDRIAGLAPQGIPSAVFYLSGLVIWNFFSQGFIKTSNVFVTNASVFGKVYFPRLITPISVIISNYISQAIQLTLFLGFYFFYKFSGAAYEFQWLHFFGLLYIIVVLSLITIGLGLIISAVTTKYRDFTFLTGFMVQLAMYCSTVIFNIEAVSDKWKIVLMLNPVSSLINYFRYIFFGFGHVDVFYLSYSGIFGIAAVFFGIIIFNKVERNFMDTV
jgi:lipopolysaccharide transport system permease protein